MDIKTTIQTFQSDGIVPGVDETIAFLKTQPSKEATEALEYVTACKDSGDFDNLDDYFSHDTMPWFV